MRIRLDHTYSASEIAKLTGGTKVGPKAFSAFLSTDSREMVAGDIFVALRGENNDGHAFLPEAMRRGAAILLREEDGYIKDHKKDNDFPMILLPDTTKALADLGRAARMRIAPTVIAITGSVGKTTTKNMVASVLGMHYRTHATPQNHNNLLGTALTLLAMPADTEILVVELGMNHRGEMAELSSLVQPDIAVITNIGSAHIGNLGSRSNIAAAKLEILLSCTPGALYLYPGNEPLLCPPCQTGVTPMTVSSGPRDTCYWENLHTEGNLTVTDIRMGEHIFRSLPLPGAGAHIASCSCFAVAIGVTLGLTENEIRTGLTRCPTDALRQNIYQQGGVCIIRDCYNASPESMTAACGVLMQTPGRRHVALLGDMLELGSQTRRFHEEIGAHFASAGLDFLLTFGVAAGNFATGAAAAGMPAAHILQNADPNRPEISAQQLKNILCSGDVLLVKASRALAAERILALLPDHFPSERNLL